MTDRSPESGVLSSGQGAVERQSHRPLPDSPLLLIPCSSSLVWFSLVMVLTSMSVVTARLAESHPLRSANDRSRWATVWSLGERGTYQIDEIRRRPGWDTIDLVRHDGHFYSSKPPLLPRLVTELYRWIRWGTGWNLTANTELVTRIILFLINVVPAGLALLAIADLLRKYCEHWFGQIFLTATACWGTLLLPFLTVFNNHTISATCFTFTLWLLLSITIEEKRNWWRYAFCGLFAAFGVCNELPSAIFGVAVFLFLLRSSPRLTLCWFVPAALLPLIAFFVTNYHATGGWKPFYMYYGTEKYVFVHQGVPSYWSDPKGIDQAKDSPLVYFLHCTIGHHGIFSLTPVYLFVLGSWMMPWLWWKSRLRDLTLLGIGLTVVVMAFYLSRTENYNYGGMSVALRWTLWLVPFWLLAMIPVVNRYSRSWTFRILGLTLLCLSVFSAWYPKDGPWAKPWIYQVLEQRKWIDYSDPRPQFDRRHFTWIGQLPQGERDDDYWIEFTSWNNEGQQETWRLQDGGPLDSGRDGRIVEAIGENGHPQKFRMGIDIETFNAGAAVDRFLIATEELPVTDDVRQFLWGLPEPRQYLSSRIRYLKTRLREDAYRCHVGYTYVTIQTDQGRSLQYVRDNWYCDDVPFGVLQWEDRVLDARTKEVLSRRQWRATATGMSTVSPEN